MRQVVQNSNDLCRICIALHFLRNSVRVAYGCSFEYSSFGIEITIEFDVFFILL